MGSSIYFKCTTNNIRRISWQYFEVKHRFAIDGILLVKGVEWFLWQSVRNAHRNVVVLSLHDFKIYL